MKVKIGDLKLKDGTTIRKLLDTCNLPWCVKCKYHDDTCNKKIMNIEVEIPQTVKRGRWEYDENADDYNIGGWRCSECGTINLYQALEARYCPHCGAKMDEQ